MTSWTPTKGGNWWQAWQYWIWFENYVDVLTDPAFWQALGRTFLMVGIAVPLEFLLGFGLALLFLDEFPRQGHFPYDLVVPMMIVPAVTGYMFYMLFQSNGPINAILSMVAGHAVTVPWLTSEITGDDRRHYRRGLAWTPLMFLIFVSGLMGLPEDQMRAATMLGASFWQKFRY